jgi:hypothetical protein
MDNKSDRNRVSCAIFVTIVEYSPNVVTPIINNLVQIKILLSVSGDLPFSSIGPTAIKTRIHIITEMSCTNIAL